MNMLRQLCSVSLGLCQSNVTHTVDVPCSDESDSCGYPFRKDISGGYCGGVPPLPIPNREVKPTYADGTAMQCGRVGSRLLFEKSEALRVAIFSGLLLFCYACSGHAQAPSSLQSISGHAQATLSSLSISGHAQAQASSPSFSGHAWFCHPRCQSLPSSTLPLLRYIADYCIGQLCLLTRGGHVLL